MTATPLKSVSPYDFRSDFEPPASQDRDHGDKVLISIAELAALLEDTRRSTVEMLRDEQVALQAEAMKESARSLKHALSQIVELVQMLEKSSLSDETRDDAMSRIRNIAAELIDGQGNLFQS